MNVTPTMLRIKSGKYFDLATIDQCLPHELDKNWMIETLAGIKRYNHQLPIPISVARHSLFVENRLNQLGFGPVICLAGLLHDGHEAFMSDLIRPVVEALGVRAQANALRRRIDKFIAKAFDLDPIWFLAEAIAAADNLQCKLEMETIDTLGVDFYTAQDDIDAFWCRLNQLQTLIGGQ